jgi:basic membrane protein A and related proteins
MRRTTVLIVIALVLGLACQMAFAAGGGEAVKGEMEVVAVMYGHANEGTWDPSAFAGLQKAQAKTPFKLSLSEGTSTQDVEKVLRNWASRGVSVIFAHSDIYLEQVLTVAKQFPKTNFIGELQLDPALNPNDPDIGKFAPDKMPPNVVMAGDTPYEGNYMAGYVAAMMSKTNKLGVLQPFEAPPLNRYSNCFYYGAKAAKPNVELQVVFVGDYIAPAETRDAVKSLAKNGCDVIFTEMDDNSAILEAAAQGIRIIPMYMDKLDVDPNAVITSVVMDWAGPLGGAIEATAKGKFADYRAKLYFNPLSVKDGSIYLGKWGNNVPDAVKKAASDLAAKFKSGALKVPLSTERLIK